jgi:hypothetical protein
MCFLPVAAKRLATAQEVWPLFVATSLDLRHQRL